MNQKTVLWALDTDDDLVEYRGALGADQLGVWVVDPVAQLRRQERFAESVVQFGPGFVSPRVHVGMVRSMVGVL